MDHVIAKRHHGETTADNLCVACFACYRRKGPNLVGRVELTGALIPLFHPRRDDWETHFEWQGPTLIGKTLVGQVIIDVLAINLPRRVDHRAALIVEGVFPLETTSRSP